jgi:hypothetical protein
VSQIENKIGNTEAVEKEFISALNSDTVDLLNSKINDLKQSIV